MPDNVVRTHFRPGGKSGSRMVKPDTLHPEPLRSGNIPFQVVAHHPCLFRSNIKLFQHVAIDPRLRFSHSELTFHEDVIKKGSQVKLQDLSALNLFIAVGDEGKMLSSAPDGAQSFNHFGKKLHAFFTLDGV